MTFGVNVDFRFGGGFPALDELRKHGIRWVRCISLPTNEYWAGTFLEKGCRVLAVVTGESDGYVMQNASAIQIGNEWGMGHDASWPHLEFSQPGSAEDADYMVATWLRLRDEAWRVHGEWFPLVGPGIWVQRPDLWTKIAQRVEGVTGAAVHVYPGPSAQTPLDVERLLRLYRNVRPDLPLMATEWDARWPDTLDVLRGLDMHCSAAFRFCWGNGVPEHQLIGTPELGILTLA